MKIPDGEKIIRDQRLTLLRAIRTLAEEADKRGGLRDQVREAMERKDARFAEDDLTLARLQIASRSAVNPKNLFGLIEKGKITSAQFLGVVTVRTQPLRELLNGQEIERISEPFDVPPALYTEFKPGVDAAAIAASLLQALQSAAAALKAE